MTSQRGRVNLHKYWTLMSKRSWVGIREARWSTDVLWITGDTSLEPSTVKRIPFIIYLLTLYTGDRPCAVPGMALLRLWAGPVPKHDLNIAQTDEVVTWEYIIILIHPSTLLSCRISGLLPTYSPSLNISGPWGDRHSPQLWRCTDKEICRVVSKEDWPHFIVSDTRR
jgi:hypothetical protein